MESENDKSRKQLFPFDREDVHELNERRGTEKKRNVNENERRENMTRVTFI